MAPQQVLDDDTTPAYGGEPGIHRVLARLLPPGQAAGQARRLLREVLTAAGVTGEALSDAELVVSELAANAELHAREPYELRILITEAHPVWCEVADGGPGLGEVAAVLARLRTTDAPTSEPGLPRAEAVAASWTDLAADAPSYPPIHEELTPTSQKNRDLASRRDLASQKERRDLASYEEQGLAVREEPDLISQKEADRTSPEEPEPTRSAEQRQTTSGDGPDLAFWEENGRGLLLTHRLTGGHCSVYPTRLLATGELGKAVAFPLPVALTAP